MEKVKIMIVDDSRVSRTMLANELNRTNFDVVAQAKDAAEAVRLYEETHPSLVTMDIICRPRRLFISWGRLFPAS